MISQVLPVKPQRAYFQTQLTSHAVIFTSKPAHSYTPTWKDNKLQMDPGPKDICQSEHTCCFIRLKERLLILTLNDFSDLSLKEDKEKK